MTVPAHADPDPHHPSLRDNYCPGGDVPIHTGRLCAGIPYADGSRWTQATMLLVGSPDSGKVDQSCRMSNDVWTRARPGACGGEWDGFYQMLP
ncbi:hypothetical protein MU0083_001692 [[Mycobacterium] kokjensenii]|uniref:Uncharacterized protein n=1 Tax=[Mycobacterium] kokjensenii TaxID=3064287 RepID=A0ABM9LE98_9MYCO|nr:hypothetical protein [Mycolicibacter sp. MU0083]CAJ1497516.1 hypothetical protein MU0083_001692 [Mycolicibacter sp. MU0083]